jgi:hypothetical protein
MTVDLKLQIAVQPPEQGHHSLACLDAAHVDVAVVGVARKAVPPRLQHPVHLVKQHVGQQRAQRPALRCAQMSLPG